jgi:hypothetical protein
MTRCRAAVVVVVGLVVLPGLLGGASPALAQQGFESVGTRAQGMAGAFVAVADDATAVYWNPAGLATGGPLGMTIGWNRLRSGNQKGPLVAGATAQSSSFTSVGTWPIGVFYGKLQTTVLTQGAAGESRAVTLQTTQMGATILQSVVPGVVVGSTLKYVRGFQASGPSSGLTAGDALDAGAKLTGHRSGAFDLDIGVMVNLERVRVGVTTRNLREPRFGDSAGTATSLKRQSRMGIAILPADGLTLAMDVDLDTVDLRGGLRRMIAFGGEDRLGSRLAVRGGIRWNVEPQGGRRPVATVGVSVALRASFWLEGYYAQGRFDGDRSFGIGLRAGS